MTGRWVGVLSLIALVAAGLNLGGGTSGSQTPALSTLPQAMVADSQTAVVGNGSSYSSTAADAQCPKANSETKTGYYPDKPWNADFKDQGYTYHNLYGKPCQGPFVKAFCRKENFCDGSMAGSQCESNGTWGACKEETASPVKVASCTSAGCNAYGQVQDAPVTSSATPKDTSASVAPAPTSAANTQPSGQPTTLATQPAAPSTGSSADSGIKAIAGSGAPPTAAGSATQSLGSGTGGTSGSTAPAAPAPSGPAFQSTPSYLSGGATPLTGVTGGGIATAPSTGIPSSAPASNIWTPGYSSAAYSGGSSPLALASNQSNSFFNSIAGLFGGLFGGISNGGGSSGGSSAPAPAQKNPVQTIIQLFVEAPPASGSVVTAAIPAPVQRGSNPLAYNIVILGTPPIALNGTLSDSLAEDNFLKLLSLAGTPLSENDITGQASFTGSGQGGLSAPPPPTVSADTLPHANALNAALASTTMPSPVYATNTAPITFVQPYAVSATAPAGPNGLSSALDLIDTYAGGWTNGKITDPAEALLENRAALAQVQTNYAADQASLSAWQALADAGLCPQSCQITIATLQSQLPSEQKQMQKLSDAVYQGATAVSRTPAIDSGITGLARDPQHAAQLLTLATPQLQNAYYQGTDAPSSSGDGTATSGTTIQAIAQYNLPPESSSTVEAHSSLIVSEEQSGNSSTGLPELFTRVWSVLTGWLSPSASSTKSSGLGCSLLGSLFGFCKNS